MSDVYVVVNTATTCDETNSYVPADSTELILLLWAFIDALLLRQLASRRVYVRPSNTPITPWCTHVHGISWELVRNAGTFRDAIDAFTRSISETVGDRKFSFVSLDAAPLRVQLPREARDKAVELPDYLRLPQVFELRREYESWPAKGPRGSLEVMVAAVRKQREVKQEGNREEDIEEGLEKKEGAISGTHGAVSSKEEDSSVTATTTDDDFDKNKEGEAPKSNAGATSNPAGEQNESSSGIASKPVANSAAHPADTALISLIQILTELTHSPSLFTTPCDSAEDFRVFQNEQSTVVSLQNLPPDTTQSELETWFTQFGGRPVALWTLKGDHSGFGFAVFSSHLEAGEALTINGRALGERAIEVQPSSKSVLDKAAPVLTPLPVSKNRPRPGDWTCPLCGFSNFQRRTACFRCAFPATGTASVGDNRQVSSGHGAVGYKHSVPFRAGDWKCGNDACQYHNFAKNVCCLKCGSSKPNISNGQFSSVNSTVAAIAAATASGQPLNFSNAMVSQMPIVSMQQQLQQRQKNHAYTAKATQHNQHYQKGHLYPNQHYSHNQRSFNGDYEQNYEPDYEKQEQNQSTNLDQNHSHNPNRFLPFQNDSMSTGQYGPHKAYEQLAPSPGHINFLSEQVNGMSLQWG